MKQAVWRMLQAWRPGGNHALPIQTGKGRLSGLLDNPQLPIVGTVVIWGCSLALAAWIASGWFWDRAAPAIVQLPTTSLVDPVAASQAIASRHLMGVATVQATGSEGNNSYRLLGLMTSSPGEPGFAILAEGGKGALVVVEGEEIVPGLKLIRILPDQVVVGRDGNTESISLD
jgi:general secretion pathway protein C